MTEEFTGRYPASVDGRKILDQFGEVYLMKTFSSWSMAEHLSHGEITIALEGIASNDFNAVTIWVGGGYALDATWRRYVNHNGDPVWNGSPWQSSLGPGWDSVDWVVKEAFRLGLTVNLSFAAAWGDFGAGVDWESATNEQMYEAGNAIARRYIAFPNIIWHVMFDFSTAPSSTRGERIDSLFHGINDAEGAYTRPVRWAEPDGQGSIVQQFTSADPGFQHLNLSVNGWYSSGSSASTEVAERSFAESELPTGDTEPAYDGSPHYDGDMGQQLRERSYATFIEGGQYINYGHEDWWPFGATGLYSEGLDWRDVPDHVHTIEQSYVWGLVDQYVADPRWAPNDSFLVNGEGDGDSKAAVGGSTDAMIVYVPESRTIVVDTTTLLGGSRPVRLRWFDPTEGTFSDVAPSESPTTSRTVYPAPAHADGTSDWVLVVDFASNEP